MINLDKLNCKEPNCDSLMADLDDLTETLSEDELSAISGGTRTIGGGFQSSYLLSAVQHVDLQILNQSFRLQ